MISLRINAFGFFTVKLEDNTTIKHLKILVCIKNLLIKILYQYCERNENKPNMLIFQHKRTMIFPIFQGWCRCEVETDKETEIRTTLKIIKLADDLILFQHSSIFPYSLEFRKSFHHIEMNLFIVLHFWLNLNMAEP